MFNRVKLRQPRNLPLMYRKVEGCQVFSLGSVVVFIRCYPEPLSTTVFDLPLLSNFFKSSSVVLANSFTCRH